jgi:hypothetical protein
VLLILLCLHVFLPLFDTFLFIFNAYYRRFFGKNKRFLKIHRNFGYAASLATLDKLVDKFPLPPVAPPIGDTSLTHVMRLAAHSTTSPTPTAMGQSFIND